MEVKLKEGLETGETARGKGILNDDDDDGGCGVHTWCSWMQKPQPSPTSPDVTPSLLFLLILSLFICINILFHFVLSVIQKGFVVSCVFLADSDTCPFIHPRPVDSTPISPTSFSCTEANRPDTVPHKYQPRSSNQPNCGRMLCLKESVSLYWETLLIGMKSATESCCLIIREVGVFS